MKYCSRLFAGLFLSFSLNVQSSILTSVNSLRAQESTLSLPSSVLTPSVSYPSAQEVIRTWDGSRSWMQKGRVVIADTETTGIDYKARLVQVSLFEVIDGRFTGRIYNSYLNPDVSSSKSAKKVHRLTNAFLRKQPKAAQELIKIKEFIGDSILYGHNIEFDIRMFSQEYERLEGYGDWTIAYKCSLAMERLDERRALWNKAKNQTKLNELTPSQQKSFLSPAPKVQTLRFRPLSERQHKVQQRSYNKIYKEWEENRLIFEEMCVENTNEARDSRRIRRSKAIKRPLRERVDYNSRPLKQNKIEETPSHKAFMRFKRLYKYRNKLSFKLSKCLNRLSSNVHDIFFAQGHDIDTLAERHNIPKHRRNGYHDGFYDTACTYLLYLKQMKNNHHQYKIQVTQ